MLFTFINADNIYKATTKYGTPEFSLDLLPTFNNLSIHSQKSNVACSNLVYLSHLSCINNLIKAPVLNVKHECVTPLSRSVLLPFLDHK